MNLRFITLRSRVQISVSLQNKPLNINCLRVFYWNDVSKKQTLKLANKDFSGERECGILQIELQIQSKMQKALIKCNFSFTSIKLKLNILILKAPFVISDESLGYK